MPNLHINRYLINAAIITRILLFNGCVLGYINRTSPVFKINVAGGC